MRSNRLRNSGGVEICSTRQRELAPTCRVCGQQMQLLDEDERGRWYCYYDDQVWVDKEQKWLGQIKEQPKQITKEVWKRPSDDDTK